MREHIISYRKADRKFYVDEFFNLLPSSPSYYCRASSSKLYLEALFQSFVDVYNLYLTKCKESERRPLSRQVLRNIFVKLNLALFHRCKYQRDVCVGYVDEHQEHTDGAQSTKNTKETVIISLNNAGDKTSVCCMDLQAVILTPIMKASCLYYKTKLCVIALLSKTSPQRTFGGRGSSVGRACDSW